MNRIGDTYLNKGRIECQAPQKKYRKQSLWFSAKQIIDSMIHKGLLPKNIIRSGIK